MTEKAFFINLKENPNEWVKLYPPLSIIDKTPACNVNDEDLITISYMNKFGLDNVRGGSFSDIELTDVMVDIIYKHINGEQLFSNDNFIKKYRKINKICKIFIENSNGQSSWDLAMILFEIGRNFNVNIPNELSDARKIIINKLLPKIGLYFAFYKKDVEAIYQNTMNKQYFYLNLDWKKLLTKKQIRSLEYVEIDVFLTSLNKLKDLSYFRDVFFDYQLIKN